MAQKPTRPTRTPLGHRDRLSVQNKDPNYHYHFINDDGDRINRAMAAGYEFVENKDVKIGDNRVDIATSEDSNAKISVGGGLKAYLMRQPMEFREEDEARKRAKVYATEEALRKPNIEGGYGTVEFERSFRAKTQVSSGS